MRVARGSDYYFVQGFAAARFDRDLSRPGAQDGAAAASWIDGSGDGGEGAGVVGGVDGNFAGRRDWRYGAHFADASAGRRSARGSVRGVRIAAVAGAADVRAERDGLSWVRADDEHNFSGARRKYSRLHSRQDAGVEARV